MINSASTGRPEGPSDRPLGVIVNRANKLQRDPLRRALLEALTRPAVPAELEEDNDNA